MISKYKFNAKERAEIQGDVTRLIGKRDELMERLDVGGAKIDEAREQGKDVSAWETYWLELLHQYEQASDKIRDLSNKLAD